MRVPHVALFLTLLLLLPLTDSSITPLQLIGTFTRLPLPPLSPTCPDAIRILQVDPITTNDGLFFVISHSNIQLPIRDSGFETCESLPVSAPLFNDLSATILQRSDQITLDVTNPLVKAFHTAGEVFFLGQELGDRTCGKAILPAGSVSMWMAPEEVITVSAGRYGVNFMPGSKYIYYFSETDPCLYRGNAKQAGTVRPVPTPPSPSPTPTPSSVAILSPVPVPAVSPVATPSPVAVPPGGGANAGGVDPGIIVQDGIQTPVPDGPACFPADAVVWTRQGRTAMRDLRVGDAVRVRDDRFSDVLGFTHADGAVWAEFVEIESVRRRLVLSSGHYVFVNNGVKTAGEVVEGDYVNDVEDGDVRVIRVGVVWKRGLYNPQTVDGDIVVDGIVVTTYTTAVGEMMTAHALLAPLRLVRRLVKVDGLLQALRRCWVRWTVCRL